MKGDKEIMEAAEKTVADAERVLASLDQKRKACVQRGTELCDERANVALAAHTGDAKARKQLDEINTALGTHASELASLDAALAAAASALARAQQQAETAADRKAACELRVAFDRFVTLGEEADRALATFLAASVEMKAVMDEIHSLGGGAPTGQQFLTFGSMATDAVLMMTPWKREYRHLAPRDRRTFADLARGWLAGAAPAIAARLGEQQNERAA